MSFFLRPIALFFRYSPSACICRKTRVRQRTDFPSVNTAGNIVSENLTNMNHSSIDRRSWLRQSSLALAGLGLGSRLMAAPGVNSLHIASAGDMPVKLNANENPYGPSPLARKAMADAIAGANRYPWQLTTQLREQIAAQHKLTKEHVLMGAGSSEILGLLAARTSVEKGNAIVANPTFGIWMNAMAAYGTPIIRVPLNKHKSHDLPEMSNRISNDTKLVYICNPNNPTGTLIPYHVMKDFVESVHRNAMVVVDEAYIEYTDEKSLSHLVETLDNLVVVRTFSKIYGLAGARVGYALAHPDMIKKLSQLQPWANAGPGAVSLAGALASLQDEAFVKNTRKENEQVRDFTCKALRKANVPSIPSSTSFIYYSTERFNGDFPATLAARQILAGNIVEQEGKWARVSVGTLSDMKQFVQVIETSFT